jgi:small subunit ribosomal protein S20
VPTKWGRPFITEKQIKKTIMANHKSSLKRIRQTQVARLRNRYYHKTTRNAVKALRNTTDKAAAEVLFPKVSAMLDKLAKTNVIHKNKAGNLKSSLQLHVNALA